jgi:nucleoid-associated protein YgaU
MSRPEDRYVKLETKTLPDGRTVYKSARPITVSVDDADRSIVANERDRLDIMANNVYGTPSDWWKLAAANKHVRGSLHVKPGTKLIIPEL